MEPIYRRIILKITGEAFGNKGSFNRIITERIVDDIEKIYNLGVQIAIVPGGGNIVRGKNLKENQRIGGEMADYMGMMATVINSLWLGYLLSKRKMEIWTTSAIEMKEVAESYTPKKAIRCLQQGQIVILAAGSGVPNRTTDHAAILRSYELDADAVLKGTKVDGVHTSDPLKTKGAKFIPEISYKEARELNLDIIDDLAYEFAITIGPFVAGHANRPPLHIFNISKKDNLFKIICGEKIGSKIY